jgi:hypothetical protein
LPLKISSVRCVIVNLPESEVTMMERLPPFVKYIICT